ncbi:MULTISPECIES: DUF6099 family protein [Streptomyces]|jgi:hypothetical protein|uniref:DUF6099 family protein n=1 Tax=Streptomyces TaxID=1883 RepID=UPI002F9571F9
MDAVRLIAAGRRALAHSGAAMDIVWEAWQTQALAQGMGHWLAVSGPRELRAEARGLGEAGGRGCGVFHRAALRGERTAPDQPPRAAQLTVVTDVRGSLLGLQDLLGEVGMALVGVACGTDDEGLYWQCMESIDAADESSDRVRALLRRLTAHHHGAA